MKCGDSSCGSYNTSLEGGPLLRKIVETRNNVQPVGGPGVGDNPVDDGEVVRYVPMTDAEMTALSRVDLPEPVADTDIRDHSSQSDSDDGWETTEELSDDDHQINDQSDDDDVGSNQ